MPRSTCMIRTGRSTGCAGLSSKPGCRAGRMLIAQGAIDACKIGVTIALRYACARPQFQDKRIMEYLTHQRRLLPALATTYAMQLQSLRLKVLLLLLLLLLWVPSKVPPPQDAPSAFCPLRCQTPDFDAPHVLLAMLVTARRGLAL